MSPEDSTKESVRRRERAIIVALVCVARKEIRKRGVRVTLVVQRNLNVSKAVVEPRNLCIKKCNKEDASRETRVQVQPCEKFDELKITTPSST